MATAPGGVRDGSAAARVDAAAVVELTCELVRLRTVHDAAGDSGIASVEQPAADRVASVMRGFGWQVHVAEAAPGRPNVVGVIDGARPGRTLMFEGHTDVVTEGDPGAWSFDPYAGDVVDGQVRGRGSADMKGGVAAMLHAARAVQLQGFDGRIIVAALADEEGMMLGAKAFARSALARSGIEGVIVCEPEAGEICVSSKGALRIRIELTGIMAHGAMPQVGRSPVAALGPLLTGLSELQRRIQDEAGPHPRLGDFYLTPTVVRAGSPSQLNVIPATAEVYLDIRTVPATSHRDAIAGVETLCRRTAERYALTPAVEVLDDRPPVETPVSASVVRALADAHERITGTAPVYGGVPGTTDGTVLTRDAGLVSVVYGPGGKWIAHQVDEVCAAEDIVTAARVYAEAAELFLTAASGHD